MMTHNDESFDETEWTADELAQLRSLRRERVPPAELKVRTISMLRERSLLALAAPRRFVITPPRGLALAAAASLVFAAGAIVGYAAANRRAASPAPVATSPSGTRAVARAETLDASSRPTRQVVWF